MEPLYQLKNIEFNYDRKQGDSTALRVDHLELAKGELLCIYGSNGAGKSTLLQLLALLERPTAGEISFNGQPAPTGGRERRELLRRITLVHQQPLMLRGTVQKNIELGLKLRGLSSAERSQRATAALEVVGLGSFADRPARELSGGETRRVALARAIALQPLVLLLDEPFAGLDAYQAHVFEETLVALRRQGLTIILTSHDRELANRLKAPTMTLVAGRPASEQHIPSVEKSYAYLV